MVSAKDKGKEPMEEDPQGPGQEEEIKSEEEEEAKQGQHPHTGTTIASIGVLAKRARIRRTARISTGGKPPRHCLAPQTPSPSTKRKEDFKEEEWGKNRKSWNSQPDMIMSRIDQN